MSAAFRPVPEDLGGTITFVGMNIQDERALALELLEETAVGWVNAEDPDGALYAELGGLGMPFTVVISADGLVTIRGIPWLAESWGWQWAFPILAAGPALGIAAMVALKRSPQAAELAGGVG
jgi:hypothetical protein